MVPIPGSLMLALAGGQGQAETESLLFLDGMLNDVGCQHDIYLMDQHSTGGSVPPPARPGTLHSVASHVMPEASQPSDHPAIINEPGWRSWAVL